MRYYEIIIMVNPFQKDKTEEIINYCKEILSTTRGKLHNIENLGCLDLAYPIKKLLKAYYIIMYIECNINTLISFTKYIKYHDFIIRYLILKRKPQLNTI